MIKNIIKQLPIISLCSKSIVAQMRIRASKSTLNKLSQTPYTQAMEIKKALFRLKNLSQSDNEIIARIEKERKHLLQRDEPLVDGSLVDVGIYDKNISVAQACRVSKDPDKAILLYLLTRELKPKRVIELGTNVGISSAYIGAALAMNGSKGNITTLDVSPYRQKLAKEVHCNLGLNNITYIEGLFNDTLYNALQEMGSTDLAFIDGHHQYKPTLEYFEMIFQSSSSGAVFIFDDIRWSRGMNKGWSELQKDERLGVVIDLYSLGIGIRSQNISSNRYVFKPLYHIFG